VNPEFMREALALAQEHMLAGEGGPFGAVLVKDGEIIARGWNRVTRSFDPTAHAEVECIRAAGQALKSFSLAGCEMYSSCEPCPMCLAAAYWAHVDRIVYAATRKDAASIGFDDAFLYREFSREVKKRRVPLEQKLRAESQFVMRAWFELPGQVRY